MSNRKVKGISRTHWRGYSSSSLSAAFSSQSKCLENPRAKLKPKQLLQADPRIRTRSSTPRLRTNASPYGTPSSPSTVSPRSSLSFAGSATNRVCNPNLYLTASLSRFCRRTQPILVHARRLSASNLLFPLGIKYIYIFKASFSYLYSLCN